MEARGGSTRASCRGAAWTGWLGAVAIAALGFGGAACGRSEQPQPSGAPMGAERRSEGENQPPAIQRLSLDPASPLPGDRIRAMATASDPDGDPVSVRYAWTVDGQSLPETGPEIAPSDLRQGARIQVVAVASDGRLESEPAQATATVRVPISEVGNIELEPGPEVMPGTSVVAKVELNGPSDGVEIRYQWLVNDEPVEQATDHFDTTGLHRDDRVAVRVTPVRGDEEGSTVRSPELRIANSPPKIVSQPGGAMADGSFRYEVKAVDPDGDTALRFRLDHGPDGMTIDPILGVITWRPKDAQVGHHDAEVVVSDGRGGESHQKFELTLRDASDDTPASPASAPSGDKPRNGGEASDGEGEAAAPAPAPPTRYRRHGHPVDGSAPAAPAPSGEEGESDSGE